jgi:hypothetical protein
VTHCPHTLYTAMGRRYEFDYRAHVREALAGSVLGSSGACEDKRFNWHVVGRCGELDAARPCDPGRREREQGVYDAVWGDRVYGRMLEALATHRGLNRVADVVLSGSAAYRCYFDEADGAFQPSDLDVEVLCAPRDEAYAVTCVDEACAKLVRDRSTVGSVVDAVTGAGFGTDTCRKNSCIFAPNGNGDLVAIEIPAFEGGARLPHSPLYVMRNDGIRCDRFRSLHRIRLCVQNDGRRTTLPLMDVKVRTDGRGPKSTPRTVFSVPVRVPTLKASIDELEKLLLRRYDNVNASKNGVRRLRLQALQRVLNSRR